MQRASQIPAFKEWIEYLTAWLDWQRESMVLSFGKLRHLKIEDDPEAIFQQGWLLCDVGAHAEGIDYLRRAVARGYFVAPTLQGRPQFDALRDDPAFKAILAEAEAGRERALAAFQAAGGERLIGPA